MKELYNVDKPESNYNKPVDDNLINKFNIIDLFGKKRLEDIQDKISKATRLAFVTVDYKGEPITKLTSFTDFCSEIRKKTGDKCNCKASDAFGGIQAAVTQKKCVYFCPCGLLEIAIPIIVRGHYLGAFIGGQVRCLDAPLGVSRLENVLGYSKQYKDDDYMKELFNLTPLYEYERFVNIADLISLIINQLGEKEAYRLMQQDSLKKELEELNDCKKQLKIENSLKEIELINLKAQLNPYFLVNVLNSISNLATIESAIKTNEMIINFAEYLKQSVSSEKNYISISEEFKNVEKFLKIQKIRYGELLKYSININEKISSEKIPSHIIMPFVENAVFYGIATKNEGGKVDISVYNENENVVISIIDNGAGFNDEKIEEKFKLFNGAYEGELIRISIANARQKLTTLFGKQYDVFIETIENKGTKSIIKYPINFDQRNV